MSGGEVTFIKDSGYRRNRKRGWGATVSTGKQWDDDTGKFGHAALEKMGWKKGNGLGSRQQGERGLHSVADRRSFFFSSRFFLRTSRVI